MSPRGDRAEIRRTKLKYVCTGRVHPERANVGFTQNQLGFPEEGWYAAAVCTGSQIIVTLVDHPKLDTLDSAYLMAKEVAELFVGALGFSLGFGYSVEIFQVTDQNAGTRIFGARPLGAKPNETLQIAPDHDPIFKKAADLSAKDVSFRRAIHDYLEAIRNVRDGAFYCYRSIEAIRSAFQGETDLDQWKAMHSALGTDRNTIDNMVKQYADPMRHGNWSKAMPITLQKHHEMLRLTQNILAKYMNHVS